MSLAYTVSGWNRRRKWQLFLRHFPPTSDTKILDVGFSDKEYSETDNFLEKNFPYPRNITALGVQQPIEFPKRYPEVKVVQYEGRDFPFPSQSFAICWSNAVVEHVGGRDEQIHFLCEAKRVAQHGFITTPNKFFSIEVHTRVPFFHWLPKPLFDKILHLLGKDWASGDYMRLLSKRELKSCLKAAGITSYTLIQNRLLGFTLDFVVIW